MQLVGYKRADAYGRKELASWRLLARAGTPGRSPFQAMSHVVIEATCRTLSNTCRTRTTVGWNDIQNEWKYGHLAFLREKCALHVNVRCTFDVGLFLLRSLVSTSTPSCIDAFQARVGSCYVPAARGSCTGRKRSVSSKSRCTTGSGHPNPQVVCSRSGSPLQSPTRSSQA